jgi:lipopolysaccharide/colanic/teichoic acid biosynthesis glycosyltransferase
MTPGWYARWGKRTLDLCVCAPALFLGLPVMLIIGAFVRVFLGSPVIFSQRRPGLAGRPFVLLKFRSMLDAGGLTPQSDDRRLTRFGRALRATSLDELPEMWNVLRGEMSLVGPRPLLMDYLNRYSPEQARRHEVRPGITGWAQVNGRNALSWEERLALDVWYVDHLNWWLDVRILALTAWRILSRQGISQPGHATMSEFQGSKSGAGESTRSAS